VRYGNTHDEEFDSTRIAVDETFFLAAEKQKKKEEQKTQIRCSLSSAPFASRLFRFSFLPFASHCQRFYQLRGPEAEKKALRVRSHPFLLWQ
jgi:hypothetical protein